MRALFPVLLALLVFCCGCGNSVHRPPRPGEPVRVGVYTGFGAAQSCQWEAYDALLLDSLVQPYYISAADIAQGILEQLHVVILPGGGGSSEYLSLGAGNRARLQEFVKQGGGLVGICAGAYLLSQTPNYACLALCPSQAIDIEHDHRGHGIAAYALSTQGKKLFPEIAALPQFYIYYYEGPVYDTLASDEALEDFATMLSDVHTEGEAPANMTNNRPAILGYTVGHGRTISCIAHPEATPGMQWMIPRMARWAARAEMPLYPANIIEPNYFGRELLVTPVQLKLEADQRDLLLYGTPEQKLEALKWLKALHSWEAKRWIQGLLYDDSPAVRAYVAAYIADIGYATYMPDLRAALANETDSLTHATIAKAIDQLSPQYRHIPKPLEGR